MIELRPFEKLGKSNHGWLNANFHFSFAEYRNPERVHWGALRVWNNDRIAPQSGFPPHPHRDMEIVTYVIKGAITHQDHLGNQGRTEAGQIQVMSAGQGIQHAEYNREQDETELFYAVPPILYPAAGMEGENRQCRHNQTDHIQGGDMVGQGNAYCQPTDDS